MTEVNMSETNDLRAKIESQISALKSKHGDKFDAVSYQNAALLTKNVDTLNPEDFLSNENKNNLSNNNNDTVSYKNTQDNTGKHFSLNYKDGKYVARSNTGEVYEDTDFEKVNDKVCINMKEQSLKEGREPGIFFGSTDAEQQKTFIQNAILKHDITFNCAYFPSDQKFWQDLKAEYMSHKNASLYNWERMTRNVPDEIMSRTPEEISRKKKIDNDLKIQKLRGIPYSPHGNAQEQSASQNKDVLSVYENHKELIENLRHGNNPNISAPQEKPTKTNPVNNPNAVAMLANRDRTRE